MSINGVDRKGQDNHRGGTSKRTPGGEPFTVESAPESNSESWLRRGTAGNGEGTRGPIGSTSGVDSGDGGRTHTETRHQRGERFRAERRARLGRKTVERTADGGKPDAGTDDNAATEAAGIAESVVAAEEAERTRRTVPRKEVRKPKEIPFFDTIKGKETLSEEFIAELWKGGFNLPHLWGWDDPENPWWPITDKEAEIFAGPSARIIARMTPKQRELFSRFADPIVLAVGLAGAVSWRAEMTRVYMKQIRIEREKEAMRAGLSQRTPTRIPETRRRSNGEGPDTPSESTSTGGAPFRSRSVQDIFDEDTGE